MAWQREITWKRFDERGEERCVFACDGTACNVEGVGAVAINGSGLVFQYRLELTPSWDLVRAGIIVRLGADEYSLVVERRDLGSWALDGAAAPQFDGCTDLDLGLSPSTNCVTIMRLGLDQGGSGESRAIQVTEPELVPQVLEQKYRRLGVSSYEYSAGDFTAVLETDESGIVLVYPGMFERALESAVR